ncbi:MAG TPA: sigma-70 family RNA polymerase sigma factor [Brevibacillus sp.]|nr:sigma-70 family RNA polymerase sigma factor [Brevibacillus sp.]
MQDDQEQLIRGIYRTYYKDVYHFLLYFTGDVNEAEDLTQEAFIRILGSLSRYDAEKANRKTWIMTIAKYTAIDYYRKRKIQYLFMEKWLRRLPATDGSPEGALDQQEEEKLIEKALGTLKPQYRMVIILRCIKGYSVKEASEILECSEAKIKVDYHRAIKQLQQTLSPVGKGRWLHELVE